MSLFNLLSNKTPSICSGDDSAKLIVGLISGEHEIFNDIKAIFCSKYGSVDIETPNMRFDYTDYYEREFGQKLFRRFLSFKNLIRNKDVYRIKKYSCHIETRFSAAGKRRVNIDPGLVNNGKLILLTTKDYVHRIKLREGIFAEVTLKYEDGSFRSWPWTYPDYKSEEYISFFNKVRDIYNAQLKEIKC